MARTRDIALNSPTNGLPLTAIAPAVGQPRLMIVRMVMALSAPLRILCRLTSGNRQPGTARQPLSRWRRRSVLAVAREPGHIKHCRSVITQRGKKTVGSEREIRLCTGSSLQSVVLSLLGQPS
jgi:hypothetical protein